MTWLYVLGTHESICGSDVSMFFFRSRVGVKRDGVVKIPGGGRIIFDITLLEVEDGENQKLYQWEPSKSHKWETTQVCAFPSQ